ncbi:hypothetical protein [Snodgrassella sp. ESL0253]|uniref:hypothetical protein n=1 Tax=Snodgrassella sp. ESL0253 TaxID=2705031 RepID=UPI001581CCA8|nr:hypothetical protein [Snodgrassella sp. ESL0253]NUE66312.1 hypothetical protein [Snodgrassella sp. ESL0253]
MKLIIKEYLASLKERKELDVLLPDLLSQMGLIVFSKAGIGNRQYGVDVAAYGRINNGAEKIYLFSIKSGNLGRRDWDAGQPTDLRPSLQEILDVYVPTHIPNEYKDKPVEICLCFGGDLNEDVRLNVTSFIKNSTVEGKITFSEWSGEKLAQYIEQYLLKEELLPKQYRSYLRKSLAMLDEPEISHTYFKQLVCLLKKNTETQNNKNTLTSVRQLYISLWILYVWCRTGNNLESAYLSSEFAVLNAWDISKELHKNNGKENKFIIEVLVKIIRLHTQILFDFILKLRPLIFNLYGVSHAINSSCSVDVNIKLFDILGRLSLAGLWMYFDLENLKLLNASEKELQLAENGLLSIQNLLKKLISNNPLLYTPYKDDHAIDISMAIFLLALNKQNQECIIAWLIHMSFMISFLFRSHGYYPNNIHDYHNLIEHPKEATEDYRKEVTKASILYPMLAFFAGLFKSDEIYQAVQNICADYLPHCTLQLWYPDQASEQYFYNDEQPHGAAFANFYLTKLDKENFLQLVLNECNQSQDFYELSAIKESCWPIIMIACRYYRLPLPLHFFKDKFL